MLRERCPKCKNTIRIPRLLKISFMDGKCGSCGSRLEYEPKYFRAFNALFLTVAITWVNIRRESSLFELYIILFILTVCCCIYTVFQGALVVKEETDDYIEERQESVKSKDYKVIEQGSISAFPIMFLVMTLLVIAMIVIVSMIAA